MARFQRTVGEGEEAKATTLELFYDLVFVFAITQVSHHLLTHLSWSGAGQSAIMLLAVWWSWNYTTWATNELDPESPVVRGLIVAVMLGSLLMAVAIPDAFGERALLFAGAYVAIQIGRTLFLIFVSAERASPERHRAQRLLAYFAAGGVLFVAGALADGSARTALWVLALLVELSGPATTYWIPGLGRGSMTAWTVQSSHFTERFQLFVIIALGESIVITGATTAELELDAARSAAFVVAFLGSALLWWLYFNAAALRAAEHLERSREDRTAMARDAYTYLHVVLVAGVIVSAVGDELVIAHPTEHLHLAEVVAVCAGPGLYLLGQSLIRLRLAGSLSPKRTTGALACAACVLFGTSISALALATIVLAIVAAVIAAEELAGVRRDRDAPPQLA